ncbi:MAG: NUDIX domain-containing protein [Proteobacteria bacterium]|nr:NUDIX domain-containing protein [Pseudomonadota bacterium]
MSSDELLETFDLKGNFLGLRKRSECHRNPNIAHKAVHILVFKNEDEIFLQKRSHRKDLYPLCWDTSVGGHLSIGEDYISAGIRECKEELGFEPAEIKFLYRYTALLPSEVEFVETYSTFYDGIFNPDIGEVIEIKAFRKDFLFNLKANEDFSPFFLLELQHLKNFLEKGGSLR